MNLLADNNILDDFLAVGSWQALVGILIFLGLQIGFWIFLKHFKIRFMYRVLMGMAIGLLFGLVVQAIAGFPKDGLTNVWIPGSEHENPDGSITGDPNPGYALWAFQLNIWISLMKNIFMNGIMLLTAPVVFIAIFRVVSKPSAKGVGRISLKGVGLLLLNVFVGFVVTFWLGYFIKVGSGMNLTLDTDFTKEATQNKPLPQIVWDYFPANFVTPWLTTAVIPLMVLGALFGKSVKILSKRKPQQMENVRKAMDTGWDIIISVLMTFMKIMPLAVMSMIASSLVDKPIGALASIGKVLGVGYLGLIIAIGWLTLIVFLSGIKIGPWWKKAGKVLIQGFATQSSNATLPVAMETLKDDMKLDDNVVSTIAPLSTSMGLMGCAGVQSGVITSFLWTGTTDASVHSMGLAAFFFLALIITLIASLGIAGVPGTAGVVTAGVLGGLGLGAWFAPVYAIVGALDGLFDMGRTGVNVFAAQAVAPIVAKSEGLILEGSPLLSEKQLIKQKEVAAKIVEKEKQKEAKLLAMKNKEKAKKEAKTTKKDK